MEEASAATSSSVASPAAQRCGHPFAAAKGGSPAGSTRRPARNAARIPGAASDTPGRNDASAANRLRGTDSARAAAAASGVRRIE